MVDPRIRLVVSVITIALMAGCGSKMAQVHGKITFEGRPVPVGSVLFAPKADADQFEVGRPATGTPNADGEFQLSTHQKNDGALVGTHMVTYSPPQAPEASNPSDRASPRFVEEYKNYLKYGKCRLPQGYVVEVKPGKNEITLDLVIRD